ncbi:MAG: hypothetical protein K2J87_02505 [Muribaculaceae bacterium]|nr:hypothetical protein [Muribaculaceae bacterium]
MKRIIRNVVFVILILICQSCFTEDSNGFINRVAVNSSGGIFIVKGETGVYSLEIGEGEKMDAYHEEYIEPDTVAVRSPWLEAKTRVGSNRITVSVAPLVEGKKRLAPITAYSGNEYAVIWVVQYP